MALRLVVFAMLAGMMCACTTVRPSGEPRKSDAPLRVGSAIEPNSFNPLLSTESIENVLNHFIYDKLVDVDGKGNLIADLASTVPSLQNGGISRDGLTITYHLRHGVRWQDGAPLTSADVRFTFDAIMNAKNNVSSRDGVDSVRTLETPDAYTVVFRLKHPYGPFVSTVLACGVSPSYVLPEHLLRHVSDLNHAPFNAAPVGSGPYRMVRWLRGDRIEFAANPSYFRGKPRIGRVVVSIIPQENTAVSELQTGELDWFYNVSETSYDRLKKITAVKVYSTLQNSYRGMLINTESPIMSDVRVRRALAYAIDKKTIVANVTYGSAVAATEDIPSYMWAYDESVPVYNYSPAKARALLAQAGWKPGPDGVVMKNGRRMDLRFVLRQGAVADTSMSVQVQAQLHDVGIATSIKTFPGSMLFLNGNSGVLAGGHYDIDLSGFGSGFDPNNSAQFTCAARPPDGFNWSRYCNPAMDRAQAIALNSYEQPVRKAAYAQIETLLARDVPQIFLYWQPEIDAVNPALKNFQPGPFQPNWNAYQWSWN